MAVDPRSLRRPLPGNRRSLRSAASAASGLVTVLYLTFGVLVVRAAEADPAYTDDTTWGGYLMLALAYLAGAVLLAVVDVRALWVVGAVLQVVVLVAFATLGVAVFEHEALAEASLVPWVVVISGLQIALLAALAYLAATPTGRAAPTGTSRTVAALPG